jgi:hypothetical protein
VIADRAAAGEAQADALASGLAHACWAMAVIMGRHFPAAGGLADSAAAGAAHTHTLPTSATPVASANGS